MSLFNSKEFLVGGKPIFISEWLTTVFVDTRLWKTKHPRNVSKISVSLAC